MKVKTIQDYYQKLFELYPTLPKSDIKRIVDNTNNGKQY